MNHFFKWSANIDFFLEFCCIQRLFEGVPYISRSSSLWVGVFQTRCSLGPAD